MNEVHNISFKKPILINIEIISKIKNVAWYIALQISKRYS